ncbi:MAG: type I-E CRISPR-associated protein Cas7/Cse4/CasC, partial [Myxococcota bacterium]
MTSQFIQIHTLTPYAATLLNRDDAGFAKRLPFGGATRTRISSQCLKRHWRRFEGTGSLDELGLPGTLRSRRTFDAHVVQPLVEQGLDSAAVVAVTEALMKLVLGESAKASAKPKKAADEEDSKAELHTNQVTVLGEPEVRYLRDLVATLSSDLPAEPKKLAKEAQSRVKGAVDKEAKKNLREMTMPGGLGGALFGRMVTSDILTRTDAAIHVAHAFTVHEQESEDDYFSAMDDLVED